MNFRMSLWRDTPLCVKWTNVNEFQDEFVTWHIYLYVLSGQTNVNKFQDEFVMWHICMCLVMLDGNVYAPANFRIVCDVTDLYVLRPTYIYLWISGWVCDVTHLYVLRCTNLNIPVNFRMSLWRDKSLCVKVY